jgi:hypothetical protein
MTEIRLIDNNGVRCAILETKNYQVYAPHRNANKLAG